mmetsp:Transcript_24404/g.59209  ORF Transcript_24404/g.59209 Transcript_24404/m.59209 type:complete len:113 (-) Transcript_24404:610-948(-)
MPAQPSRVVDCETQMPCCPQLLPMVCRIAKSQQMVRPMGEVIREPRLFDLARRQQGSWWNNVDQTSVANLCFRKRALKLRTEGYITKSSEGQLQWWELLLGETNGERWWWLR